MITNTINFVFLVLALLRSGIQAFTRGEFLKPHDLSRTTIQGRSRSRVLWKEVNTDPFALGEVATKCLLDHMYEIGKAELSVCSVRLGLLPVALQMIGPKVNEISTLAL
jgi:hypothetical protein